MPPAPYLPLTPFEQRLNPQQLWAVGARQGIRMWRVRAGGVSPGAGSARASCVRLNSVGRERLLDLQALLPALGPDFALSGYQPAPCGIQKATSSAARAGSTAIRIPATASGAVIQGSASAYRSIPTSARANDRSDNALG